ncbi:MAG TPA: hypothetical protein VGN18_19190 [Jatrophihabitans sp.]|jgi:uridine kinase|uniref:uridine kinase family protein n=1 Tax=Jatrophihabitans sp. TaxID=1932789 RepID=UPI002DFFD4E6|nr:hypothetical protein [Jatrophihabitans sp.]
MDRFAYRPSLAELAALIRQRAPRDRPGVVAISGYGGSGKTTLADALGEMLGTSVVGIDEFATAEAITRSPDWSGLDRQRLATQVLEPVRGGATGITYDSCNDWLTWCTEPVTRAVGSGLIVEGIGLLHPELLPLLDTTIWLDVDLDTATARGVARAVARGVLETELWTDVWGPNERDFARRFAPRGLADILVTSGGTDPDGT